MAYRAIFRVRLEMATRPFDTTVLMSQLPKPTSLLITPGDLREAQANGTPLLVFDCSFDLAAPANGRQAYLEEHIPGAIHADLDHALSAAPDQGVSGGRHPLPRREFFARWLAQAGLSNNTLAVVYDRNRLNFCGRLWWMLRWAGHDRVAVLDGGLQAWKAAGGPTRPGEEAAHPPGDFSLRPALTKLVDAEYVRSQLGSTERTLVDARTPERFRGEVEPLDAVAGHIPGARNRPFSSNLNADGTFKSAAELRTEFGTLLGGHHGEVIHYCGSGVSATPNVLAMEVAGLGTSSLYAGSWSDWSRHADYPKAKASA